MPVPHYDEKGRLISYDGLISDITERKKAEDSLRKSENKYRTLLEHLPQKIFYKDRNSVYISCNKNYANDLRINLDEIIGKTDYEFFPKELVEKYRADDKRLMNLDRTEEMEEKYVLDGKEYFVHTIKTPIKDDKGNTIGVMGIFRDITEHKKLEDQLRHAQKMEAIGTLAGGIAHDFNNILNVIMGFGSIVMDMLGDDHVAKGHMKEVIVAAERAVHLTKRLLLFSRKAVAEFKPVDVNEMIINMEKMLSQIIGEDINFVTDLMGAKAMVMADAGQMEQVLINLATNARDAMPKGGKLTISTEIKEVDDAYIAVYGYGKTGTYALISVTDTGTGMDAETQEKIFEPFFTTKGVGEGTGLGLAIAYGIIKQHDGYIKVYSKEGKGTTFKILLPVIEEAKARGQEIEAAVPAKGGTETILVAEDDAALRKLAKIVLESSGYTVITAEDGEEAITKYMGNRDKIQLVVLDMIMPKKSGKEAYDEIKKISPDVKALFASGYTMDIITKKELLGEDMEIVVKPIPSKDLLRKVREILDR
jgi:PAS domain S-box-containing protein